MRRMILCVLSAVAVALGCSVGVADAWPHVPGGSGCPTGQVFDPALHRCVTPATGGTLPTSCPPGQVVDSVLDQCDPFHRGFPGHPGFGGFPGNGFGPGGPIYPYPGVPQGFPTLINGDLLSLQALGLVGVDVNTVNVCSYPTWTAFDGQFAGRFRDRWGVVRNRFGGNATAEWLALRQAARCSGAVPVPVNGFPTLINGSLLNLDAYGLGGAQPVNVCSYPTWDAFSNQWAPRFGGRFVGFRGRFGGNVGAWRSGWVRLRQQAACSNTVIVTPPSSVIINNDPAPTTTVEAAPPAPTTVEEPAPSSSSNDNPELVVPHGSVNSGGFDAAYAAAHGL